MKDWVLGVVIFLVSFLAGVTLVAALLTWLRKRREQEKPMPAFEIEVPSLEPEATGRAVAATEPPAAVPAVPASAEAVPEAPALVEVEPVSRAVPVPEEPAAPLAPDDLTRLEGIGPKISGVLRAAGIAHFSQLAATEVDTLKKILGDADPRLLRLADPTTWAEQAALAATGDWEALKALTARLRGGRQSE